MSYSAQISFKIIKGDELYSFFQKLKEKITEKIPEIAKDNYIFSPFAREPKNTDQMQLFQKSEAWAKTSIFTYRFFYKPEYNLLGVFSIPDSVKDLFDLTCYFQNSCDQDYDFDEWKGISIFEEIAEKWQNSSDEYVKEHYIEKYFAFDDEDDFDCDYHRRSFAYDEIWDMCKEYLNDETKVVYLSLFGFYDISPIQQFISHCHDEYENFINDFKKNRKENRNE